MKKLIYFLFTFSLFARINPFEPVITPNSLKKPKKNIYFKKAIVYLPNDARILKKVIFVYQSVSSDIKQKEIEINKDIDFHSPIILIHNPKKYYKKRVNFNFFSIEIGDKKIFINTKDKLIRNFFLIKPFRLVLDFKGYSNFTTIKKNLNSYVKKIVVGSHSSFYRVVIYLDANYKYKIVKKDKGIEIELF